MAHFFAAPLLMSFGLGAGVVAVARPAASTVGRAARPMAKGVILGGLVVGRGVRRAVSEAGASFGDLVDEAREAIAADESPAEVMWLDRTKPGDTSQPATAD
jgi:hypothetical protein